MKTILEPLSIRNTKLLFWTCFIAEVATSFGFVIRTQIIGDLGLHFALSETQKGEILGVGLWPFAISIILFGFIIDKIGYGRALSFAFICHISSAIITVFATSYWMLFIGTFILAIGNGAVEAVISPLMATLYPKEKTKWINIVHASWPAGIMLGGLFTMLLGPSIAWQWKVLLILIPVIIYGIMLLRCVFPISERVKAGVSYKEMLKEAGIIFGVIVVVLVIVEIGRIFNLPLAIQIIAGVGIIAVYWNYVRTLGSPILIFLLLIMIPLATTELGIDSWITELVTPIMSHLGLQAGWILVYTAFIMMVLRFSTGHILKRLTPLGLLATCSALAVIGLLMLSKSVGIMIFVAATIYAVGKTFFWGTMMGVVAERFPKGGALTINAMGGVGMLSVGIIGAVFLGNIQDKQIDNELNQQNVELHTKVVAAEKSSIFGKYFPLDQEKLSSLNEEENLEIEQIEASAKKSVLETVAILPLIMLICYIILIIYFKRKGGYKPVELEI